MDWDAATAPIAEADIEVMEQARRGQSPSRSGFKMRCLQHFPLQLRRPMRAILQTMWRRKLIPNAQLQVLLITLPKPNGGERGISLVHPDERGCEGPGAAACTPYPTVLAPREDHCGLLSGYNKAYKKGGTCASYTSTPWRYSMLLPTVCLMTDLAKFYDTVQIDLPEVVPPRR